MVPFDYETVSALIRSQLPQFLQVDHETFVAFLEAYYEYLEQYPGPLNVIHNHTRYVDVDTTLEEFIFHFRSKFMAEIPANMLADPRKLAKHIREFYRARGTEKSYQLLFRILYDKDVEFYYPKNDILIYSDGKWVEDHILFVTKCTDNSDPFRFVQTVIVGEQSGAMALVDVVRSTQEGTKQVYQLLLNQFEGIFTIGERVTTTLENGDVICGIINGFVESFEVTNPGLGYQVGDFVPVIDATGNGINALGRVKKVFNPGNITRIDVVQGGNGYRVGDPIIFDETFTVGFGAEARVSQVSPDQTITTDITIIGTVQNVVLDTIDHIVIEDYVMWETFTMGAVEEVEIIDGGQNYDVLPLATVGQQMPSYGIPAGVGAIVVPGNDNAGAIKEIEVVNPGVGYIEHPVWPQADLTGQGDGTATADVNVSGGPYHTGGYYKNYDGHYSSIKYIQDGEYYQLYSYVLKVDQSINNYRDVVKELVHPAGMKMFGLINIQTHIKVNNWQIGVELADEFTQYVIKFEPHVIVTPQLADRGDDGIVIKLALNANTAFPIFIYHYEEEMVQPWADMLLMDHPGFTNDRGTYNRSSVVTLI